ncbi:MAG: hypothetical protein Q4C12_02955 [Clostridia bacterium]|nr:hypothetical protein [Clostridia bacterium]
MKKLMCVVCLAMAFLMSACSAEHTPSSDIASPTQQTEATEYGNIADYDGTQELEPEAATSVNLSTEDTAKIEALLAALINHYPTPISIIPNNDIAPMHASNILWNLVYRYGWIDDNGTYRKSLYHERIVQLQGLSKSECDNVFVSALGKVYDFEVSPQFWGIEEKDGEYFIIGADGDPINYVRIDNVEQSETDYHVYFTYYEGLPDYEMEEEAPERPISSGVAVLYRNASSIFDFTVKQCTPDSTEIIAPN